MSSAASTADPQADAYAAEELDALLGRFAGLSALVLAVSGGPDSMGMLAAFARWRAGRADGPALHVASVDHGLRPEARAECEAVAAAAARLGIAAAILTWEGGKPTAGLQEKAREARRRLLGVHARDVGAEGIVLAHTIEDQAETVLMRLVAGSGPAGLKGMAAASDHDGVAILRPFLWEPKGRLAATARAAGLTPVEDPSNRDERFARVRARRVLSALSGEGLTAETLATLAGRLALVDDAVEAGAAALAEAAGRPGVAPGIRVFDGAQLLGAPLAITQRLIARAIGASGEEAAPERLQALETLSIEVLTALAEGAAIRRTLRGAIVSTTASGRLIVAPEGPRRNATAPGAAPATE